MWKKGIIAGRREHGDFVADTKPHPLERARAIAIAASFLGQETWTEQERVRRGSVSVNLQLHTPPVETRPKYPARYPAKYPLGFLSGEQTPAVPSLRGAVAVPRQRTHGLSPYDVVPWLEPTPPTIQSLYEENGVQFREP